MEDTYNTRRVEESLQNDDVLIRLEKLSAFLDQLVHDITQESISKDDVSRVVEHISLQKKIYEQAHKLYESVKEEDIDREQAYSNLNILKQSLGEYEKFKKDNE